ncbi:MULTISPECIES: AQJ64_40280 family protein [unclassified Nocardiopsis]|uniref:AQJ64_40280 family protein n=1 Tax=unclassified Nocardiopsis TaxID=2649073 RepID=UPI0013595817|nr:MULTISPECIES: AQJ64_40280 family protein [unclassified Nocardiopsis]
MRAEVEWVDVRERLPRDRDGMPLAAAITGRLAPDGSEGHDPAAGQEFWLVRPMYFTTHHIAEDGREYHDCFVDSDGFVRFPYGRDRDDSVTHWAELPTLPGTTEHYLVGEEAGTARANAWGGGT